MVGIACPLEPYDQVEFVPLSTGWLIETSFDLLLNFKNICFKCLSCSAGHGPGMGSMLAGGAAAAAAVYGAHHLLHGAHHYGHGAYMGHHHGKFKHGKFGKRWKHGMFGKHKHMGFKRWK